MTLLVLSVVANKYVLSFFIHSFHLDMAIATAVLNLWSSIGSSISIAISASVWNKQVPAHLEKYLGSTYNATELAGIFGSINVARVTEPRDLVKKCTFGVFFLIPIMSIN